MEWKYWYQEKRLCLANRILKAETPQTCRVGPFRRHDVFTYVDALFVSSGLNLN